jgi:hypothetical protein
MHQKGGDGELGLVVEVRRFGLGEEAGDGVEHEDFRWASLK